jgi:hypothetical protein
MHTHINTSVRIAGLEQTHCTLAFWSDIFINLFIYDQLHVYLFSQTLISI